MKKKRLLWAIPAAAVLLLAALLAAVPLIVAMPPVQNYIITAVEQTLAEQLGADITIGSVGATLQGTVTASDIRIRSRTDASDSLTLGSARANVSVTRLFFRTVHVPVMVARDVRAALTRYENGRLGPFDFPPADTAAANEGGSPWTVELGVLTVAGAAIAYRDTPVALDVSLNRVNGMCRFVRLDSLALDLEGRDGRLCIDTLTLDSLALRFDGAVSGRALRFRTARMDIADGHLTVKGLLPFSPEQRMGIHAQGGIRHGALALLHPTLAQMPPGGTSTFDIELQGELLSPALSLTLHSSDLRWRDFRVSALACTTSYDGVSETRADLELRTSGRGTAAGSVVAHIDSLFAAPAIRTYDLTLRGSRLDIPWLARAAGVKATISSGRGHVALTAAGDGIDKLPRAASVDIGADLRNPPGRAPGRIDAALTLDRGMWSASATWGENALQGEGTVALSDGAQGTAHFAVGDPAALVSLFVTDTVRGTATVEASFHAGFDGDITADATVATDSLAWRSAFVDSLNAGLIYRDGALELEHATASGHAGLDGVLSRFDLSGVNGEVSFRAYGHGPVTSPVATLALESPSLTIESAGTYQAACSVSVARDTLRWHDCSLRDSLLALSTRGSLALQTLFIDGDLWAGPRGSDDRAQLALRGIIAPDSLDCTVSLGGLKPSMAAAWLPNRQLPHGAVAADIGIKGTLSNPAAEAVVRAPSLAFGTGRTLSLHLTAALDDSLVAATLHAAAVDTQGHLQVQASLPLRPSAGWRVDWSRPDTPAVHWHTDTLDCGVFSPLLPVDIIVTGIATSSGTLRGRDGEWLLDGDVALSNASVAHTGEGIRVDSVVVRASAGGTLDAPQGSFVCTTGTLSYEESDRSVTSITARGRIDMDELALDTLHARVEQGGIWLRGRMPFGTGGIDVKRRVSVDAECVIERFPLAVASPFVSGMSIDDGELSGEARVRYESGATSMEGQLRIDELTADVPDIEPRIGPSSVRITLARDTVYVDTLQVQFDKHALRGQGWGVLPRDGALPLYVRLEGTGLSFAYRDMLDVRVDSAAFELNGSRTPYRLNGRLVLDRSTYTRPVRLTDLASYIRSSSVVAPRPDADSVWRTIRLDMRVRTSSPVVVDFDIARVRATAEVLVQGTPAEPQLGGTVQVVDGHVWYLDRKFIIERGVFQQSDPARLNPMLDVLAKTELSPSMGLKSATRYKIRLRVTGTLDNPTVDLQSDPSLSQIDIVSLLTLGRVRNADEEALALETGSDLTDALAEKAKVIASQQLAGYVTRRIERWLNLDQVSIEGNIFGVGGSSGPRLSVSKQVRDRLTLTYQSVIGNIEEQTIKASLKLAPHVYLEGETDAQDNAGLDLKLKWSL